MTRPAMTKCSESRGKDPNSNYDRGSPGDTRHSRGSISSTPPSTLSLSPLPSFSPLLSCAIPSKQIQKLTGLPRYAKVALTLAIVAVLVSFTVHRGAGTVSSLWLCGAAERIFGETALCGGSSTEPHRRSWTDWRLPSEEVWRKFGTNRCTIERVSVTDLPPERFEAEFRFKKPVIVTFPNGAADWTDPEDWSKAGLTRSYSDWTIHSGESLEIVRKGGNANHASSFEDYVNNLLMVERSENDTSEPKHYACDRQFFWYSKLGSGLRLPTYFQINTTDDESIFFLGPSLSGVVFHKHSDTWNGVVYGYKRWFMYPNTRTPPGGVYHGYSLMNWVKHVYPNLSEEDKPMECVQAPGEILYLAEATYHATLNMGDTVAVAIQKRKATIKAEQLSYEATQLNNFLQTQENTEPKNVFNKRLLEIYKEWHVLLPDSSEAVMKLGAVLFDMGEYTEALPWYRKAIEMDRYFIMAYLHLGKTLSELRQYEEADESFLKAIELSPELWDNYRGYGEFLLKRGRHQDALPIYKKGTELMPDMIPFWFYHKLCQVHLGDLEGAEASERVIKKLKEKEQLE